MMPTEIGDTPALTDPVSNVLKWVLLALPT